MVQFTNSLTKDIGEEDTSAGNMSSANSLNQDTPNGISKRKADGEGQERKKKRKSKSEKKLNGISRSKRRHSVSKPARDPRDEASPYASVLEDDETRSPSPVIDFDGLSKPSMRASLL